MTYVAGCSVALSGMLCLAAALLYLRSADRLPAALASPALFALALAARETAWTLPFALLLLDAARGRRWRETVWRTRWHWLVLGAGLALAVASPTYRRLLATSLSVRGPLENLFAQVQGAAYLLTHPLVTLRIGVFDPDVAVSAQPDAAWLASAALLAALVVAGLLAWRRQRWLAVGILWFFLEPLPTNGLAGAVYLVNDRQLYLALAGPALIVAVVLARLPRRPGARRGSVAGARPRAGNGRPQHRLPQRGRAVGGHRPRIPRQGPGLEQPRLCTAARGRCRPRAAGVPPRAGARPRLCAGAGQPRPARCRDGIRRTAAVAIPPVADPGTGLKFVPGRPMKPWSWVGYGHHDRACGPGDPK